ncbi:MAG: M20/M25/M40 family metallo-hydrolase [Anaerolineae bacterium]
MTTAVDKSLIKTLVESWGPPGYEHKIRAVIQELVADLADEIRVDAAGSLICRIGSGGKKVMIAAHMDEIGLIVHHIDRDGYARFSNIGTLFPSTLNGNRVLFDNGVIGTIGMEHAFDPKHTPQAADFYVDFSDGSADNGGSIGVGSTAAMYYPMVERGERLIAKSMDDRIGCAVAIMAMRQIKQIGSPNELYFVFTTQEEVGVRGAKVAASGVAPDYGIALDVCPTGDLPQVEKLNVRLGQGAAILIRDALHIVPPKIKELFIKRAEEAHIPYQLEILDLGSTDASGIQQTGAGVPSATISIPCRYVHTTSETVDVRDVAACVDLLVEVLAKGLDV